MTQDDFYREHWWLEKEAVLYHMRQSGYLDDVNNHEEKMSQEVQSRIVYQFKEAFLDLSQHKDLPNWSIEIYGDLDLYRAICVSLRWYYDDDSFGGIDGIVDDIYFSDSYVANSIKVHAKTRIWTRNVDAGKPGNPPWNHDESRHSYDENVNVKDVVYKAYQYIQSQFAGEIDQYLTA